MKVFTRICFLLLAGLAVSCGKSGESKAEIQFLPFQLVITGVAPLDAPALPAQVTVIANAAQLAQISAHRFAVPASLANFDFTQGDLVYVEAFGDRDATSVVRLLQVSRNNGADNMTAETCISTAREAGTHRPFALYTISKLMPVDSIAMSMAFFDCPSVQRLLSTVIASGVGSAGGDAPPYFIRDAASYGQAAQFIGLSAPSPNFAFSQTMLVMYTMLARGSTVRFMGIYQNVDGSRDFIVEMCNGDFHPDTRPYVLVSIPASDVDPRIVMVRNFSPSCLTQPP